MAAERAAQRRRLNTADEAAGSFSLAEMEWVGFDLDHTLGGRRGCTCAHTCLGGRMRHGGLRVLCPSCMHALSCPAPSVRYRVAAVNEMLYRALLRFLVEQRSFPDRCVGLSVGLCPRAYLSSTRTHTIALRRSLLERPQPSLHGRGVIFDSHLGNLIYIGASPRAVVACARLFRCCLSRVMNTRTADCIVRTCMRTCRRQRSSRAPCISRHPCDGQRGA